MGLSRKIAITLGLLALLSPCTDSGVASAKSSKKPATGSSCSHPWKLKWSLKQSYGAFTDRGQHIRLRVTQVKNPMPEQADIACRWYGLRGARICKVVFHYTDGTTLETPEV